MTTAWQPMHRTLREHDWRRGRDGLWRHTPEIGGSFLTRNALAIVNGASVEQVVAQSRVRYERDLRRRRLRYS
jgi:hypothetical protein